MTTVKLELATFTPVTENINNSFADELIYLITIVQIQAIVKIHEFHFDTIIHYIKCFNVINYVPCCR